LLGSEEFNMEAPNLQKNCVHHWIIDDADGIYSFGRCTKCGLVKRFINNWEEILAMKGKDISSVKVP
jgi:hypothetical protein